MNLLWILLLCMLHYTASQYYMGRRYTKPKCIPDEEESWSYGGEKNGPRKWGQSYPTCFGRLQSPIDIKTYHVVPDASLEKLEMENYDVPVTRATVENNGHTIQVTPTDDCDRCIVVNDDVYHLTQLHFHWGDILIRGAEHTINGNQHSMELHLVHANDAGEIAVVGVFFEEAYMDNEELQNIVHLFPKVLYKDTQTGLKHPLILNHLLPENPSSFFRYKGSLTTPPCTEGVTWSVLTSKLPVGVNQMKQFRNLYSVKKSQATKSCKITNNFRPVQPMNGRTVYISH